MQLRLSRSIVGVSEAEAVRRVIEEDGYLGMGAETRRFEEELAAWFGVEPWQVITTNTGTAALTLAVDSLFADSRLPERGGALPKVLVPSLTFVASFQAIVAAGCRPVACDVLPQTGTLDLRDAEKRLDGDVIAIMPVHYASNPWHLDEVYDFARRKGLRVIEDAAHAFGCRHHGIGAQTSQRDAGSPRLNPIVRLVQHVESFCRTYIYAPQPVLRQAGHGIAPQQARREGVRTEHIHIVAVVPAKAAAFRPVPHVALAVLQQPVDVGHGQLPLRGQFRPHHIPCAGHEHRHPETKEKQNSGKRPHRIVFARKVT